MATAWASMLAPLPNALAAARGLWLRAFDARSRLRSRL